MATSKRKLTILIKASNASHDEVSAPLSPSSGLSKMVSFTLPRMPVPPTIVHRTEMKGRPSLPSIDGGVSLVEITPDVSPSTSAGTCGNSGKSSVPENHNNSTGKTSQDSKFSLLAKKVSGQSQHSSQKKTIVVKQLPAESAVETPLMPIQETQMAVVVPEAVPSRSLTIFTQYIFVWNSFANSTVSCDHS